MTRLLIVAAIAVSNGCMSLSSVAIAPGTSVAPPRCTPQEAAALPEGARVELTSESIVAGVVSDQASRTRRVGTILKASPEGIALVNCVVEQRSSVENPLLSKTPYVSRLFRNTGVGAHTIPVVWIPVEEMGQVRVLEAPPADYVSPGIEIDTTRPDLVEAIGVDFVFNIPGSEQTGLVERITDDCGGFSGNSPRRYVELVDPRTGEVFQRKFIVYDGQGSHEIQEPFGGRELGAASLLDESQESPGVQSLGRRTSGHGPATPDPGTARID